MSRIHSRWAWLALGASLVLWSAASDPAPGWEDGPAAVAAESDSGPVPPQGAAPAQRWREGSLLKNMSGAFELVGDRVSFRPSDHESALPVLENLALERVGGMLESAGDRLWSVSGTVTEFRGRNYLLIDRAVIRARRPGVTTTP